MAAPDGQKITTVNKGSAIRKGSGAVSNQTRDASVMATGSKTSRGSGGITAQNTVKDAKANRTGSNIKRRG